MPIRNWAAVCLLCPSLGMAEQATSADALFAQAQTQLYEGDYRQARDSFATVWKEFARTYGDYDFRTLEARIFHGQLLAMVGDPNAAMTVLGPISNGAGRLAMLARGSFALALRQAGEYKKAAKMLTELVRVFPAESRDDRIHLGRMHSELAVCLAYLKRYREAEASARDALRQLEASDELTPAHRASVNTILGQIYLLSGQHEKAYASLANALEEAGRLWKPSHPEIGILEGALGVLALRAGRYEEAERRTRASLAAMEAILGPDHHEVGLIVQQLALLMKKQKRKAESREFEARARDIFERSQNSPSVSAWSFRQVQ